MEAQEEGEVKNGMDTEEEKEFKIREQVRLRMEAKIQEELRKIEQKVRTNYENILLLT